MSQQRKLWLQSHARVEKPMVAAVQKLFVEQAKAVAENLLQSHSRDSSMLLNVNQWNVRLKDVCREHMLKAAAFGIELARAPVKDYDAELSPLVWRTINETIVDTFDEPYWGKIDRFSQNKVQTILSQAADEQWSIYETARKIEDSLSGMSLPRATAIARTEITGIMNAGQLAAMQELQSEGVQLLKAWSSVIDDDTRIPPGEKFNHVSMNGQERETGQDFNVSGEPAPYPGYHKLSAGNRVHCRCGLTTGAWK